MPAGLAETNPARGPFMLPMLLMAIGVIAVAAVSIAFIVQRGAYTRTRVMCETDVELARLLAGKRTTAMIRIDRFTKHRVSADLPDPGKMIEPLSRGLGRTLGDSRPSGSGD